jgi:hypothetical protein
VNAPPDRFRQELEGLRGVACQGEAFRMVSLHAFLRQTPPCFLYARGPFLSRDGQRFSPPGQHEGLYIALDRLTAGAEFAGGLSAWQTGALPDCVTFTLRFQAQAVLDLGDPSVLAHLGTTAAEMQEVWEGVYAVTHTWPATWVLGYHAFASGRWDGIRFPSIKNPGGFNLLLFTERLRPGSSSVSVHDEKGLEREALP